MDKAIVIRHNGVIGTFVPHLLPADLQANKLSEGSMTEAAVKTTGRDEVPSGFEVVTKPARPEENVLVKVLDPDLVAEADMSEVSGDRQTIEKTRRKFREAREQVIPCEATHLYLMQIQHQLSRLTLAYKQAK